jgi:hypothetical protein
MGFRMAEKMAPAPGNEDTAANTEGRDVAVPGRGFGQLWEKTFRVALPDGTSPTEVMAVWKEHLHELWPDHSTFHGPDRGIRSGEVAGIDLGVGPARLSTGVLVTESTPTSFSFQSPEGHMLAGRSRFTTASEDGGTVARIQVLFRANDPLYELGLLFGGHRAEDKFWATVLSNLAARYGEPPPVSMSRRRLDHRRRWRNAGNIRKNAAILTTARRLGRLFTAPIRALRVRA